MNHMYNFKLFKPPVGFTVAIAVMTVMSLVGSIPFVAKADPGDLSITCGNVSVAGNVWTLSGTWQAYDFPGQSNQYDVAVFSPAGTLVDSSSKDTPDTFTIQQGPSDYTGKNQDDMQGIWSNQITFASAPTAIYSTLYHSKVPGNETSGDATCSFVIPPQCSDGLDNDSDGFIDYPNDPGCTDANDDNEFNAPVNNTPVAVGDSYTTNEDTAINESAPGVLSNDTDADSDPLTTVLVAGPTNGTLTLNTDGSFTYTPSTNFNGADAFTYKANDGNLNSNVATVTITVNAVNDAPIANNDVYSTNEEVALVVSAPGVLSNDTDVEGSGLSAALVAGPTNGTLTLNTDGSFTYTPGTDFVGSDSFTYKANDGTADSNVATVTINVSNINDAPVANNDTYSTNEDVVLNVAASGVLGNDFDVDGDAISASLVDSPLHGSVSLNGDGSLTYTPHVNYHGPDSFTYKVNDGALDSSEAVVNITVNSVNDAPVADNLSISTAENISVTDTVTASDVDGDALTYTKLTDPANGTITAFSTTTGVFTYEPATNFNGSDSFTFKANDGLLDSNTGTVNITVDSVNDPPVITLIGDDPMTLTVGDTFTDPGATADDTEDGDITDDIVIGGDTVDTNTVGSYVITYNVTDSDGAAAVEVTRTVNVLAAPDKTPPVSEFDDNRNHQIISSQIYELSLAGNSEDLPNPGGSGVASAEMSIYRIVDAETAQGEGFYNQYPEQEESLGGFYGTYCSPLPQGAVLVGSQPIDLSLSATSDPMVVTWAHPFTASDLGVYCAIVHATDNNGNVEHTAIAGPFAFNPPAPPPPCTVNCGGGGGGGGGGGSPLADLGITITIPGGNPTTGGVNFTYLLTLTNYGPSTATNAVVTNVLPGTLSYITDTASQGAYDSAANKWNVGTLPVGSSVTLNLTVALATGTTGTITEFASAISSENDPVLTNNTDTYVFDITEAGPTPQVLGATTEALPRTGGMPLGGMLYLSWLAPFFDRFRVRKLKK